MSTWLGRRRTESLSPRSPTMVSKPLSSPMTKFQICAICTPRARATGQLDATQSHPCTHNNTDDKAGATRTLVTSCTAFVLDPGLPYLMLYAMVSLNRTVSWGTMPMCCRNDLWVTSEIACPLIRIWPWSTWCTTASTVVSVRFLQWSSCADSGAWRGTYVVEPEQQASNGTLACAGVTHHSCGCARRDGERNALDAAVFIL